MLLLIFMKLIFTTYYRTAMKRLVLILYISVYEYNATEPRFRVWKSVLHFRRPPFSIISDSAGYHLTKYCIRSWVHYVE